MKIVTILGTRPEIIKLSQIIPKLDKYSEHTLIHTDQNFATSLNEIFFKDLGVRKPDIYLETKSNSTMSMIGKILEQTEQHLLTINPDRVLILGDTYSGLSAFVAKRLGIPVFHMEAGNRCYDDRVPEEVNRRIIDTSSDIQMPYTERSREILLGEGYRSNRIFVIGNPIFEVLENYRSQIDNSNIINKLNLKIKKYFALTLHRSETVNIPTRLEQVVEGIEAIYKEYNLPIVCSMHPHTADQLKKQGRKLSEGIMIVEPMGFFDFVKLESNAICAISDSGTVQEEGAIFHFPSVLIRDVTERYETIDAGSNYIAGIEKESIVRGVKVAIETNHDWPLPREYTKNNVSDTVLRILLSNWDF